MRVLVVTARFPRRDAKGDQSRVASLIAGLAEHHEVTVLTAADPGPEPAVAGARRLVAAPLPPWARALAAVAALSRGVPGQVGWMMPRRSWRVAERLARDADVVLVNTVRSARGPLPAPVVVDHVDALSLNMRRRAGGPEPLPVRLAARVEAGLLRRHEARVAAGAAAQVVTAREDAEQLPAPRPAVVPVTWDGLTPGEAAPGERDIDVILTGNMAYPPNQDAARWLAEEIAPALRRERPQTSIWVVGRDAARLRLGDGVRVASDVADLHAYLRRARVAVVPLRIGTGSPFKLLEAAACGAAVVCTAWAAERFDVPVSVADDTAAFARAIAALLDDEPARAAAARAGQEAVARHTPAAAVARVRALLEDAAR